MNSQIKAGLKDSIPFGVGFIPLYLSIGMLAAVHGVSLEQVMLSTAAIFSTPLQFLLTQGVNHGYILIPIILTLNARFLLMAATLAPFLSTTRLLKISLSSVFTVPSIVTGCLLRFKRHEQDAFTYYLTLGFVIYIVSLIATLLGFIFGHKLQTPIMRYLINITLPLQFTALAAKHWPDYFYVITYWGGFLLAPFLISCFHAYTLTIGPFIIGGIALLVSEVKHG